MPVGAFVIDLVRDGLLIEVQTRGFAGIRPKLTSLLDHGHRVRLVHPIPAEKWIVRRDLDEVLSRRRSPRRGEPVDVFSELVSFPGLVAHPQLEIELLLTVEEEWREHTPGRSWRRNGWSVLERRLIEVKDRVTLLDPQSLVALLPDDLTETFTTADLAVLLRRPLRLAQQATYCLRRLGAIVPVGKVGNSIVYRLDRAVGVSS